MTKQHPALGPAPRNAPPAVPQPRHPNNDTRHAIIKPAQATDKHSSK